LGAILYQLVPLEFLSFFSLWKDPREESNNECSKFCLVWCSAFLFAEAKKDKMEQLCKVHYFEDEKAKRGGNGSTIAPNAFCAIA
jgi:hypothetical protein